MKWISRTKISRDRRRMGRLSKFVAAFALLVFFCVISWKLYASFEQARHASEYRKRISITALNVFDANRLSDPDNAFRIYAVDVVHTTLPFRRFIIGGGVYLGNGTVLTAEHVVGKLVFLTNPRIFIAGQDLPASVIKEGSINGVDLALLSIDRTRLPISLQMRKMTICQKPTRVGAQVVVAYPNKIIRTRIISPRLVSPEYQSRFNTLINEPEGSGSGVFDAGKKCLLGIISREVTKFKPQRENGKILLESDGFAGYFVPASQIRNFLH